MIRDKNERGLVIRDNKGAWFSDKVGAGGFEGGHRTGFSSLLLMELKYEIRCL